MASTGVLLYYAGVYQHSLDYTCDVIITEKYCRHFILRTGVALSYWLNHVYMCGICVWHHPAQLLYKLITYCVLPFARLKVFSLFHLSFPDILG